MDISRIILPDEKSIFFFCDITGTYSGLEEVGGEDHKIRKQAVKELILKLSALTKFHKCNQLYFSFASTDSPEAIIERMKEFEEDMNEVLSKEDREKIIVSTSIAEKSLVHYDEKNNEHSVMKTGHTSKLDPIIYFIQEMKTQRENGNNIEHQIYYADDQIIMRKQINHFKKIYPNITILESDFYDENTKRFGIKGLNEHLGKIHPSIEIAGKHQRQKVSGNEQNGLQHELK